MADRRSGYLTEFDLVKNRGTIHTVDGEVFEILASDMKGDFKKLQDTPGVQFDVHAGKAVDVTYDPDAQDAPIAPRSGLAIMGAAQCPNCVWRIPILPVSNIGQARKVASFDCPNCGTGIRLKSMFIGLHNILAVFLLVFPFIFFRFSRGFFYAIDQVGLGFTISIVIFPIFCLMFVYLYIQEKLVIDTAREFD